MCCAIVASVPIPFLSINEMRSDSCSSCNKAHKAVKALDLHSCYLDSFHVQSLLTASSGGGSVLPSLMLKSVGMMR
jgi:hypothetical protein